MKNIDLILIIAIILLIYFSNIGSFGCENFTSMIVGQNGIDYGDVPLKFVTSMSDPRYYYTSQQDGTLYVPDSYAQLI